MNLVNFIKNDSARVRLDTQWQFVLGSSNAASVRACRATSVVTSSIHIASVEELARAQQL